VAFEFEKIISPQMPDSLAQFELIHMQVTRMEIEGIHSKNRTIATIDPLGNTSTTVWDPAGRRIASINPLGATTTSVYDGNRRLVSLQTALGYLMTLQYDAADRNTVV
jgi:YD repeat-containing protein